MSNFFGDARRYLPSRRAVLRGAGVAIALPWLESLVRPASAQAAARPKRFMAIFLPNGAPDFWKPPATGVAGAWQLSSVLEPLAALKAHVTVISGLENGSVFNADGSGSVEPSHGRLPGAWLTCADAGTIRQQLNVPSANGVSVDQIMAQHPAFAGQGPVGSLQIGLSTVQSYCDGQDCNLSRSVSWGASTAPLSKEIDPNKLFARMFSGWEPGTDEQAAALLASRKSVLDAVLESAGATRARLSAQDKIRLDGFLDSVRGVELKIESGAGNACQAAPPAPAFPAVGLNSHRQNTAEYDKGAHFDVMNELAALAFQCNLTRIISYMLEDERSEFSYGHVGRRSFTALTSAPAVGTCGEWHAAGQHGAANEHSSIVHWHVGKVAALCQRLSQMDEGDGHSVLDNSIIYLAGAMHGANHSAADLPVLCVGGGSGTLKTDQHVALTKRPLRDFYFTLMNGSYGMNVTDLGVNRTGAACAMIDEISS